MALQQYQERVSSPISAGLMELYEKVELCDVTIIVEGKEFKLHQIVLASVSEYCKKKFEKAPKGYTLPISDPEVTCVAFDNIVKLTYGKLSSLTSEKTTKEILEAALFLKIAFLVDPCIRYLSQTLQPQACLEIWKFAEKLELAKLEYAAREMASREFETIRKRKEFEDLSLSLLRSLLSSKDLNVRDEANLCNAIFSWVKKDRANREQHLSELLPFVRFTNLPEEFLDAVRTECTAAQLYIDEASKLRREQDKRINSSLASEILARRERRHPADSVDAAIVCVGGVDETQQRASTLEIAALLPLDAAQDADRGTLRSPGNIGTNFASCMWRNELYVSGGSSNPEFFAVYNAGRNAWKPLTNLPEGRVRHTMVAAGGVIYVLAGHRLNQPTASRASLWSGTAGEALLVVRAYNTTSGKWVEFRRSADRSEVQLTIRRTDVSAAVLGHRIYVLGGRSVRNHSQAVECINVETGEVYMAGYLPSPGSCVGALGDGGAVFVARGNGEVLRLREKSNHVEEKEKLLPKIRKEKKAEANKPHSLLSFLREVSGITPTKFSEELDDEMESIGHTVQFQVVITALGMPVLQAVKACIHSDELYISGTPQTTGTEVPTIRVNLREKTQSQFRQLGLPTAYAHAHMHLMYLPKLTESLDFRFSFNVDDPKFGVDERLSSNVIRIHKFEWRVELQKRDDDLVCYLCKEEADDGRNWTVTAEWSVWLVPHRHGATDVQAGPVQHTFRDSESEPPESDPLRIIAFTDLQRPEYAKQREVTIQISVSIVSPPQVEAGRAEGLPQSDRQENNENNMP